MKGKAKERIEKFEKRVSDRKWNPKTVKQYILWAERLEKWTDPGDFESYEGVMFDFDTYLADLPENPPWNGSKRKGEGFSYRSRIQALSAAKLYLQLMYGARLDRDVDEFVSGEKPEFSPEYYEREEVEEIFEKTNRCTYPHCHAMTRLGYDCILRCAELVQVRREDVDLSKRALEVRAVKRSIPREVQFSGETAELLEPVMEDRESGHLFLTYETESREGVKPFEPESWSRHFRREHNAKFHKLARHSSIIHKLQDGWNFGDVYLQARHQHPSMTAKYAEFAGVEAPDWAEESPF
ncbi:hypothetical protein AKJ41_02775 [candidate division MSBL1 archaeon SCGC-AAA259O05]|uniref:Tyr recombinase domain-containing protein n=1 Tax=candidate division MSBL1 archaeon SCGC-AAA259O05 TaxID=1698271 RepID=A0A133V3S2_9EURY|nr:hypothetical protein AKJ41_02775 [candidate division MSBL1 archaeon SCGC-AAA259O05]